GDGVFDGVFGGLDVDGRVGDFAQGGKQRHGFAGAGGPTVQDHAIGLDDALAVALEVFLGKAQCGDGQGRLGFVENAHDDLFAEVHRAGGHTQVNIDVFFGVFLEDD